MSKILLDYVFPISVIEGIPAASTAFLKQAAVVAKPKTGQESNVGQLFTCTNISQVSDRITNDNGAIDEVQKLFDAGMSKVLILLAEDLDLAAYLVTHKGLFFTLLISSDFVDEEILGEMTDPGSPLIPAVPAVKAELKVQDILFRARDAGIEGNAIKIEYVDTSTIEDGTAEVSVAGTDIMVNIEEGVTTAQTIAEAIADFGAADDLVEAIVDDGDEADPQDLFAQAPLAGGADEIPEIPAVPPSYGDGTGLSLGAYDGVTGLASDDPAVAQAQAIITRRSAFFKKEANGAQNCFYAFGKLLSNLVNWRNQQFIEMPLNDDVDELGEANSLFDDRVSFVIHDDEFGNRLAMFAAGGKAIVAPYILKNLRIDLQSRALQWIAQNQPDYTIKEASLLEIRLQEDVINAYIGRSWISGGTIQISLQQANFVASGEIEVPTPKALWRVFNEMTETT